MGRTVHIVLTGLLAFLVAGLLWAPAATATSPVSLQVSVNGAPVPDGDRVVVPEANLSVSVTGDVNLASVVVRVNDEDRIEATPNTTKYETDLDPEFLPRSNSVHLIVKDEQGDLASHRITIYKDMHSPDVSLTSPFKVSPDNQFPPVQPYTTAAIELNGTVEDASNITSFSARVIGDGQSVKTTTLSDGSFSLDTTLALGNNSLLITATDEYGHRTDRTTRLEVTDEDDPNLTIRGWPNVTEESTVYPTIMVNDSVAVQSVSYQVPGQPDRTPIEPTSKLLDTGRTEVSHTSALKFYRPGTYNVTFNVTDYVGNWTEVTKTIEYDPTTPEERVTPDIQIDESRSGMYNDSLYRLTAEVRNGSVNKIHVGSEHRYEGVTHFETVYNGLNISEFTVEEDVRISAGHNEIIVRATDALQNVQKAELVIETDNTTTYEPPGTDPPKTTQRNSSTIPGVEEETTTAEVTQISVAEPTPLTPVTETTGPTSPALSVLALVLAGFLLRHRAN